MPKHFCQSGSNEYPQLLCLEQKQFNPVNKNKDRKYIHYENMAVKCIPSLTPLLYRKNGVYRGIHFFFIFDLKRRLWVLVRIAARRF